MLRKGYHREINSYSAFFENDRKTPTGLAGYLRERGFRRVFLAGLAFDFCVRYSAEDARREGFEAIVIEDACRGIDVDGSVAATRELFRILGIFAAFPQMQSKSRRPAREAAHCLSSFLQVSQSSRLGTLALRRVDVDVV